MVLYSVKTFFGRRKGRPLRAGQAQVMQDILPAISITLPKDAPLDPVGLFDMPIAQTRLEIGFGGGEHLATQAQNNQDIGFLGCEPFVNGVAKLVSQVKTQDLKNVRVFPDDARLLLAALKEKSLERVDVLFPDPWPKKRHASRRFIQKETLAMISRALKTGGALRLATDVEELFFWMSDHLAQNQDFVLITQDRAPPDDWVTTRYEQKARALGAKPFYALYQKVA